MTRDTLYSIKSEVHIRADSYRITKFVDGNVESSYTTTFDSCDCPAGVRPSCRHRQMLPQMIAADIVNTQFFWDFDLGRAVDFSGTLKSNIDAMNELAVEDEDGAKTPEEALDAMAKCDYWNGRKSLSNPMSEALHSEPNPNPTGIIDLTKPMTAHRGLVDGEVVNTSFGLMTYHEARQTFTIPEGYEAVRDADGRATGEVQPITKPFVRRL